MKIYIALATILIAGAAYAQKGDKPKGDACKNLGEIAAGIMNYRQSGKPLHEMMERATSTNNQLLKSIVIEAYERPIFPDAEGRTRTIADFRNDVELVCYKSK